MVAIVAARTGIVAGATRVRCLLWCCWMCRDLPAVQMAKDYMRTYEPWYRNISLSSTCWSNMCVSLSFPCSAPPPCVVPSRWVEAKAASCAFVCLRLVDCRIILNCLYNSFGLYRGDVGSWQFGKENLVGPYPYLAWSSSLDARFAGSHMFPEQAHCIRDFDPPILADVMMSCSREKSKQ